MSKGTNKLTEMVVKNAKPKDKPYKLADGGGLFLLVQPDHKKYWRLKYRISGKEKLLAIGVYPGVSLSVARSKAAQAKAVKSEGSDPMALRKQAKRDKEMSAANTFEAVAGEWHAQRKQTGEWSEHHAERVWRRLEVRVFPAIGDRPVAELTTRDLLYPVQKIAKEGKLVLAGSISQYINGIMRKAVQTQRIERNPAQDMRGGIATPKPTHRPALSLERLPELKQRIDQYSGFTGRHAMQFALLTGARSSEFRFARWSEFALDRAEWIIPAEREAVEQVKHSARGEKMGTPRIIPLASQTVALLRSMQTLTGGKTFVFESEQKRGIPISENTPNMILRKLGYDTKTEICLHGFRTMACSSLNESGLWNRDAIERHMGHQERDNVRAAYQHKAEYLQERKRMLQWWADYLDAQATGFIPATEFRQDGAVIYMAGRNSAG